MFTKLLITKRWPLWLLLCLSVALILRVWLVIHTNGVINGDEALVGIQAEHILHGEWPVYFYGQVYMGSLEAYLIAFVFAVAGPSVWALRAEPILLSLAVVWLTWKLANALAEEARLSPIARRYFVNIAVLFAAISPLYVTVQELRTLGGYIEAFVLMLLLLISALRLTQRWRAGASSRELSLRWAGIGFLVGLGFWVNPLIISTVLASAAWIIGYCLVEILSLRRQTVDLRRSVLSVLKRLSLVIAAIPTSIIGSSPALYWGANHNWMNVAYLLNRGSGTPLITSALLARLYFSCAAPRVVGGMLPGESIISFILHIFPLVLGVLCIFASIDAVIPLPFWHHPLLQARRLVALPLLFAGFAALLFFIGSGPDYCPRDMLGRYATPLGLVLPFLVGATFSVAGMYIHETRMSGGVSLVTLHRTHREEQLQVRGQGDRKGVPLPYTSGPFDLRLLVGPVFLFILLSVSLCAQVLTYGLSNPGLTFQSPSCADAPANNEPIIAYMQQEHIRYAWAVSWIANPIIFKTNEKIIIADPRTLFPHLNFLNRMPAYVEAMRNADRPSMLVFIQHGDPYPLLEKTLDAEHVVYHAALFPSQPGIDILVVTPLSRTVSPLESAAFQKIFVPCKE
ncbi:MAG TPA: hypothetical protein VF043_29330 [Ktedonobacteraceae bacterium]